MTDTDRTTLSRRWVRLLVFAAMAAVAVLAIYFIDRRAMIGMTRMDKQISQQTSVQPVRTAK